MSVRRSIIVLALVTLALPIVVFALRANRSADVSPSQNLQRYTVARGDVELTVTALGTVQADQVTRLSFASGGRVVELPVAVGAAVQAGDLLARLDDTAQQISYEQAALGLELARLRKEQLLAGADEFQIRAAEASVESAQGAVNAILNAVSDEDLRAAELQYQQAQQALEDATQARATAAGGQSDATYALLDARVGQASFNAEIARLQLEQLRNGSAPDLNAAYARVTQAQRELERLLAGPAQADLDRADAQIAQAQLQVDDAQMGLDRLRLTAPFDGVMTAISAEIGSLAAPGLPVVEIADLQPLRLTVQVDEIDVRQIEAAMPARVQVDALPGVTLAATLERIALVASNDNGIVNYDVRVRLDEGDPRVRVGMTAEAAVVVQSRQDALVVPNQYIRLDRARNQAFVNRLNEDDTLREVEVTLGLQGEASSEVVGGLDEGDIIAINLAGDAIPGLGG